MLLTISIPTFNREHFLKRTLESLYKQKDDFNNLVEILVSDNASIDNTNNVIEEMRLNGLVINYIKNETNLGPDTNINNCYLKASGKYVLTLADDDILLPNSINIILNLIKNKEYGLIYLNFYGFKVDPLAEKPAQLNEDIYEYNGYEILKYIKSNLTFISANIINRKYITSDIVEETGSNLTQVICAARGIAAAPSIFINRYLLAQQVENSGGYNYFNVFGVNMPKMLIKYTNDSSIAKKYVYGHLLKKMFPYKILVANKEKKADEILSLIQPYFSGNLNYWFLCYPVGKLYYPLAKIYLLFVKLYGRMYYWFNSKHNGKRIIV